MFLNQLIFLEGKDKSITHETIWENLNENEKTVLEWLSIQVSLEKETIDEQGRNRFGPYFYYVTMEAMLSKSAVFLLSYSNEIRYIIPRELDRWMVCKRLSGNERAEKITSLDLLSFRNTFLLYMNHFLHGNTTPLQRSFVNLGDEQNKFFQTQSEKLLTKWSLLELDWIMENQPDDLLEKLLNKYWNNIIIKTKENINATSFLLKKMVYGVPVGEAEIRNILNTESYSRLMNDPFFQAKEASFSLEANLDIENSALMESFHLHGQEFVFPNRMSLSHLWRVFLFGAVTSIGQMIHIDFSKETIQKGKQFNGSSCIWQKLLELHPFRSVITSMQARWEDEKPVVKTGSFVLYRIHSHSLLTSLMKDAEERLGKEAFLSHESGILVVDSKIAEWEKYLTNCGFRFDGETVKTKSREIKAKVHYPENFFPKEWDTVSRLSEMSFQLMSYKENMMTRLIRQSQALKLPILLEDAEGNLHQLEVKSLVFELGNSYMLTYHEEKIPIHQIRKVALIRPENKEISPRSFRL